MADRHPGGGSVMATYLVTGGLGLVGSNMAARFLHAGHTVRILDNRSRGRACEANWQRLQALVPSDRLELVVSDIESAILPRCLTPDLAGVVHAAAQVSVSGSQRDPVTDFRANAYGTFNLLEQLRSLAKDGHRIPLVMLATNKCFRVSHLPTVETDLRYQWPETLPVRYWNLARETPTDEERWEGVTADFPFWADAEEPYGASKLAGLFYGRAYASLWNLPICILAPSGMYGPWGFGGAEQGWLNWFVAATLLRLPITIYGTGKQVRDMLYVEDACRAIEMSFDLAARSPGSLYAIGGGRPNAISLLEALDIITKSTGDSPIVTFADWRPNDYRVYHTNVERMRDLGWTPEVAIETGIAHTIEWAERHLDHLRWVYAPTKKHGQ